MDDRQKAAALAAEFLEKEQDYQMGYIEAEQSHPKTKTLDSTFEKSVREGLKMLLSVDADLVPLYERTLNSEPFERFAEDVYRTLKMGKRIILSGCGSSGRLCMRVEKSFREAAAKDQRTAPLAEQICTVMTGGDYALIRAVEFFEDYTQLSAEQIRELKLGTGDLLIGVTATAETTSVLGTAEAASDVGAAVYMVVCSDPKRLAGRMERAKLYERENVHSVYLPCGAMAVTGSTRMQSSTIEQAVIASALEKALCRFRGEAFDAKRLADGFSEAVQALMSEAQLEAMSEYVLLEERLYRSQGHVTYFSTDYVLDILTDTTERAPTYATPPLRPQHRMGEPLSWAFVKDPTRPTAEAWTACFGRKPRCISWTAADYQRLGAPSAPDLSENRLLEFEIGWEEDPERKAGECLAVWIDEKAAPEAFQSASEGYRNRTSLIIPELKQSTWMDIFPHIAMKLMLNSISTGVMVRMGRVSGNYMSYLDMSNKKLIDRGSRIISDLCGLSYADACRELYYSYLLIRESGEKQSPAQHAIRRLRNYGKESENNGI